MTIFRTNFKSIGHIWPVSLQDTIYERLLDFSIQVRRRRVGLEIKKRNFPLLIKLKVLKNIDSIELMGSDVYGSPDAVD